MRASLIAMFACALTICRPDIAFAAIVPVPDLSQLTRDSDLVGLGTVASIRVTANGTTDPGGSGRVGQTLVAVVLLDGTLKGESTATRIDCKFWLPRVPNGYLGLPDGYRLLFLKSDGDGYRFTNPYYPSLPAVPVNAITGADPLAKVAAVLSGVLRSSSIESGDKRELIWILARNSSPQLVSALREALHDRDVAVQLSAVAALLQQGQVDVMPAAEKALLDSGGTDASVLQMLRNGVRSAGADSSSIPALSRLLRSTDVATRRAAAAGLRRSGSARATPFLISALDDADSDVRYTAVIGLSEISGDSKHSPSIDAFRSDESSYIAYWKRWAAGR